MIKTLFAIAVCFIFIQLVFARITGTKHDFQENGGGYPITGVNEKCTTYHDPHMRVAGTKFLVTSNTYLCQICHNM